MVKVINLQVNTEGRKEKSPGMEEKGKNELASLPLFLFLFVFVFLLFLFILLFAGFSENLCIVAIVSVKFLSSDDVRVQVAPSFIKEKEKESGQERRSTTCWRCCCCHPEHMEPPEFSFFRFCCVKALSCFTLSRIRGCCSYCERKGEWPSAASKEGGPTSRHKRFFNRHLNEVIMID